MTRSRILVTGSRDWMDQPFIEYILATWRRHYPDAVLVHGDCRGADRMAGEIWSHWGLPVEAHPADWGTHGHAAGPRRNQRMVTLGADICLAFLTPSSRGTRHCAQLAEAAGIPVYRYVPEESP
ncbi:hypothetical protein GCM10012275_53360 [Longimycelium tulufanense]|uniref:YspA cpYpsA-related SLOG domain-containing protein n=1 Tax=Longimycelium tulufanense TaxID=907463 RepID=A0A8J3FYH5_9PSEU|nr:DUF2493 domain-containing protein [Longimycelium tulufanense]GGM75965.1 hypothetical protein GCM10012275_53360 [Longimycelium tulufanense]